MIASSKSLKLKTKAYANHFHLRASSTDHILRTSSKSQWICQWLIRKDQLQRMYTSLQRIKIKREIYIKRKIEQLRGTLLMVTLRSRHKVSTRIQKWSMTLLTMGSKPKIQLKIWRLEEFHIPTETTAKLALLAASPSMISSKFNANNLPKFWRGTRVRAEMLGSN